MGRLTDRQYRRGFTTLDPLEDTEVAIYKNE